MKLAEFASGVEKTLTEELNTLLNSSPTSLKPLLQVLIQVQLHFEQIVIQVNLESAELKSAVDSVTMLGNDSTWQTIINSFKPEQNQLIDVLFRLWYLTEAYERTGQVYQQAAIHAPYPSNKVFLSSLAEVKKIVKRKLDVLLRIVYNQVWSEIGFAPFNLGRD